MKQVAILGVNGEVNMKLGNPFSHQRGYTCEMLRPAHLDFAGLHSTSHQVMAHGTLGNQISVKTRVS